MLQEYAMLCIFSPIPLHLIHTCGGKGYCNSSAWFNPVQSDSNVLLCHMYYMASLHHMHSVLIISIKPRHRYRWFSSTWRQSFPSSFPLTDMDCFGTITPGLTWTLPLQRMPWQGSSAVVLLFHESVIPSSQKIATEIAFWVFDPAAKYTSVALL